ncbi:MAG: GxxExxY protein [Phycisphaerae bacterium]
MEKGREDGRDARFAAYEEKLYPERELTERIIGCAIEVHRQLGPGYLERIYQNALIEELVQHGLRVASERVIPVFYRGKKVGEHRIDLLVEDRVVLELKSVEHLVRTHIAQLRSTLKAAGLNIGLLMNFNQPTLKDGLQRVVN